MNNEDRRKILENVPPLRFWGKDAVGWYCLAGAITRYMEYVGDSVPYSTIMGISGAAWRLVWNPHKWSPDNLIMGWYGHLSTEERILKSLEYGFEYIDREALETSDPNAKKIIFEKICDFIDKGKPAIACGIAGPEECLIVGYGKDDQSLLVQSFFENRDNGYFETNKWYEDKPNTVYDGHCFSGLLLIGGKRINNENQKSFLESIKWGLQMAIMGNASGRTCGLAAYDAWACDMLEDNEFPMADSKRLEEIAASISDNGIVILDARKAASDYLRTNGLNVHPESQSLLVEVAELFKRESEIIGAAHEIIPWGNVKGDKLKSRMERSNREKLSQVIQNCKSCYNEAFEKIRKVIEIEEGL